MAHSHRITHSDKGNNRGADKGAVTKRRRITPRQIGALVVFALLVIFIVQNRTLVQIHLFGATLISPLWFLLVIMCGLGLLLGLLIGRRR